ncbi:MAG: outer membrane PBP1 activator LpoA protein [Gammaproteobacteria bacterium]|jgi:outer membrane PBP1 activator LpoA protein
MRHNTPIFFFITLSLSSLALIGLSGCGPQTSKPETPVVAADVHAKELYQLGNFYAAAEEYLALAESDPKNEIKYQLGAADALIKDQEIERAEQILETLPQDKLSDVQRTLKTIYQAQISLTKNDPETAWQQLNFTIPVDSPRDVLAKFHATRATTLHLKHEYFAAAKERILLNSYLNDPQEIADNNQNLWLSLSQLSLDELNNHQADSSGILASWMELAIINQTMMQNTANLETAIATWQQRYPDHPALGGIIPEIINSSRQLAEPPSQIALLLPFTGRLNDASIAIREGFMAAWYESRDDKPIIKIYNTDVDNIVEKYEQAISEGADFIVGPLQKDAISKLIEEGDARVTTLVLNQYDGQQNTSNTSSPSALPSIIQFGLSPEDEAKQVAERAWFDGRARAITISTGDERSQRVQDAFTTHWQALGGITLEHVNIGQDVRELADPVRRVLNINQSEQRGKTLRSKLQRSLRTETRRRQDVDLIFMTVPPEIGRQLVPQLRYYRTDDIVLYSISNIFTGNVDERADDDINNVTFVDMPWVINPENEYSPLNRMIERYRKPSHSAYKRLYAFGIDAYSLIPHIAELVLQPSQQYEGKTGYLKIDREGRVLRRSIWAKFVNGKPELSDTVGLN